MLQKKKLTASLDLRFEKSPWFLIVNQDKTRFIANPYHTEKTNQSDKVIEMLKKEKVTKVITGEIGPKAKDLLDENRIQLILLSGDKVSLQYILKLNAGR